MQVESLQSLDFCISEQQLHYREKMPAGKIGYSIEPSSCVSTMDTFNLLVFELEVRDNWDPD